MLRLICLLLLIQNSLWALDVNDKTTFNELFSHTEVYEDRSKSETIATIQKKEFKLNKEELVGYGYSPNYDVWIRFTLVNKTTRIIEKIIEYDNPLTSKVVFFEDGILKKEDGLLYSSHDRISLNPILNVILKPHQSKQFYIKASSKITPLIVKLNLWNNKEFEQKEKNKQTILTLFFGAMFIMIIYHISVSLLTKEKSYIYYVLFSISITVHHFIYTGATNLYVSSQFMLNLINFFSVIVAISTISLALYTRQILSLKEKYPKNNKVLYYLIALYVIVIAIIEFTEAYSYRSLFFTIVLVFLFYTVVYALLKKDRQAYLIIFGWVLFMISGLLMYLSSSGTYDIFQSYPYLIEASLVLEIVTFSFALSSKINMLNKEKIIFIEKERAYEESEHRLKNSIQTILSFITFQKEHMEDKSPNEMFTNLERRIIATSHLHSQLDIKNTNQIFSSTLDNFKESFKQENIKIDIYCDIELDPRYTKPCSQIIYEAVTNSVKYAFENILYGHIEIRLSKQQDIYQLTIKDNGKGFEDKFKKGSGSDIIEALVTELDGTLTILNQNGVQINVIWRENDK